MSHAWTHSWCRSPSRDEAVRASEDGRSGPLPTLEECIERVTERRPVDAGGGGNVTRGLRTERVEIDLPPSPEPSVARVTLEFSGRLRAAPSQWPWDLILSGACVVRSEPGDFFRVVEESDRLEVRVSVLQAAVESARNERDAAIRERDTLRAERITQALTADRFAAAVAEADTLRARVAELEEQLESVADRAAAAETALQSSGQADEEDANIGYALRLFVDGSRVLSHELDRQQAGAFLIAAEHLAKYLRTEYQPPVEESAPAASGAAGTGWLTADERLAVSGAILILDQQGATNIGRALDSLLNRSSPPEVVLEGFTPDAVRNLDTKYLAGWDQCMALAKRAILAAGVKVKEVGRE